MGAKTWMLGYADGDAREALARHPALDREATARLAVTLFPKDRLEPLDDGSLLHTCPSDHELIIGSFPGVSIVAAREFGIDYPSRLDSHFIDAGKSGTIVLHAMHSVVDWFAYAVWSNGTLTRSLSLSPDSGVMEDIGSRMAFEEPYWAGRHPAVEDEDADSYPFAFHPLELGEAALAELFGYQLEGTGDATLLDPETIPLARYKRARSWWKLW